MEISGDEEKHILFTGGTGFLGSFLSAQLLREGYIISFLVRPKHGKEERTRISEQLREVGLQEAFFTQVHIASGDLTKPLCGLSDSWIAEHKGKISEIWHTAGLVAFHNRERLFSTNVDGIRNIIELTQKLNAHLHYISTAYVAGNLDKKEILEDELKRPLSFRNPYEESKYEAERLVREFTTAGHIASTIYRPSIIIGHSQTGQAFSFTGYYIPLSFFYFLRKSLKHRKFLSKLPIIIPYYKDATLNLIPVDHAVRLITSIARYPQSKNKAFHIVHPNPPLVKFIFEASLRHLGYPNILFIKLSILKMKILKRILILFSYLLGRIGRNFRTRLGSYLDYLIAEDRFSTKNVKALLRDDAYIPALDRGFFTRCIDYAVKVKFGR